MTHKSLWKAEKKNEQKFPILKETISADIAIIGGGITGLCAAYLLEKAGKKVVLLEAGEIGAGATGFSSCHLTTDLDFEYRNVFSSFDEKTAKLVAASRVEGIDFLAKIVNDNKIDCGYKQTTGYLYTEVEKEISWLEEEAKYAAKAGLPVRLTDEVPLPFKTVKGLIFPGQAEFNAYEFITGIAGVLTKTSCSIFENSRVTDMKEQETVCEVKTAEGSVIAGKVIVATHLPMFSHVLQTMAAPYRSYMLAAELSNDSYPEGLFWDSDDPYHYTRTYAKGPAKWLVVGGEDHKTGTDTEAAKHYANLENYVRSRYDVRKIAYQWSAQYYEPVDGLPYIGKIPFWKKVYIGTGFSGDGLVYGPVSAMVLTDLIQEKKNKWADVFDPGRFNPLASAKDFIKENADVVKHFVADRFDVDEADVKDLKTGDGKILEKDGEKFAVARDKDNKVYALSPVCTHLKCFVQWNSAETSWDCPCHGSRFTIQGEVIEGPAVNPLEQKSMQTKVK